MKQYALACVSTLGFLAVVNSRESGYDSFAGQYQLWVYK